MANPKLSRLAAKLFNEYNVPLDKGLDWAIEIEKADSIADLSTELKSFLTKPYFLTEEPKASFSGEVNADAKNEDRFTEQGFEKVTNRNLISQARLFASRPKNSK